MQEIDGRGGSGQILAGDAGKFAALTADGHVKALVSLISKLLYSNIFANFHASADLHTDFAHDVDLGFDDLLVEFIGRDAVLQHTAGDFVFLEHGGFVAHRGEVIGAAQTGRAAADDGDLLLPEFLHVGTDVHFRHEAGFCLEILFRDELLHRVDGDGLVDGAARAGILAATVADASADRREWVLALDEFQSFRIFALGSLLQIALHRDMRRTGCFTRCCARRVAVDAVLVTIVLVPLLRSPLLGIGKLLFRIGLLAVLGAEFLSQTYSSCRTVFHATAASHAVRRIHLRHVGTATHVGRVEQLGSTQRIADLYVAVADGEDFAFTVDIGDLVYKTMILCFFQDGHALIVGDEVTSARLRQIFCHIANADTPIVVIVGAAFIQSFATNTAGADAHSQVAFVAFKPI